MHSCVSSCLNQPNGLIEIMQTNLDVVFLQKKTNKINLTASGQRHVTHLFLHFFLLYFT